MALIYDIIKTPPKALTFDVFGTVVDWRTTLVSTLIQNATAKISASSTPTALSPEVRERLSGLTEDDWGQFAQEWRNSYKKFTLGYNPEKMEWRDIDTHHHQSLIDLLKQWKLETLYSEAEVKELSRIWHFLDPWADSSAGLHKLGTKFITSTLSNGTRQLLRDLNVHCDLGFQMIQSSEDFKAYKPHASTYLGSAKAIGVETQEVAMVAAHLADLKSARDLGFRTIYVERKQEEDWDPQEDAYREAKNWVDMWIPEEEDGFLEVARRFGIN